MCVLFLFYIHLLELRISAQFSTLTGAIGVAINVIFNVFV